MRQDGRYLGISNAEYHSDPAISRSQVLLALKSYSHYLYAKNNPTVATPAMQLGSATHSLILTPELNEVAVCPNVDRRTKAGKEEYAAFEAQANGKIIIKQDEYDTVMRMKEAIYAHPEARRLMEAEGDCEASYWFHDPATGLPCRVRPDKELKDGRLVDIKTTKDASPVGFAKSVANFMYHVQDAMYRDGTNAQDFLFVAVESAAPHGVAVYSLDEMAVEIGRAKYKQGLEVIRYYEDNPWVHQGYSEQVETLSLPAWAA